MSDEPFGRQPKPVIVTLKGEPEDIRYWLHEFMRRGEFKGDRVTAGAFVDSFEAAFTIYPRAVNDWVLSEVAASVLTRVRQCPKWLAAGRRYLFLFSLVLVGIIAVFAITAGAEAAPVPVPKFTKVGVSNVPEYISVTNASEEKDCCFAIFNCRYLICGEWPISIFGDGTELAEEKFFAVSFSHYFAAWREGNGNCFARHRQNIDSRIPGPLIDRSLSYVFQHCRNMGDSILGEVFKFFAAENDIRPQLAFFRITSNSYQPVRFDSSGGSSEKGQNKYAETPYFNPVRWIGFALGSIGILVGWRKHRGLKSFCAILLMGSGFFIAVWADEILNALPIIAEQIPNP